MKKIKLTADYDYGIEVELGKRQVIQWGGAPLEITSQEFEEEIAIQLDLMGWLRAQRKQAKEQTDSNNTEKL